MITLLHSLLFYVGKTAAFSGILCFTVHFAIELAAVIVHRRTEDRTSENYGFLGLAFFALWICCEVGRIQS